MTHQQIKGLVVRCPALKDAIDDLAQLRHDTRWRVKRRQHLQSESHVLHRLGFPAAKVPWRSGEAEAHHVLVDIDINHSVLFSFRLSQRYTVALRDRLDDHAGVVRLARHLRLETRILREGIVHRTQVPTEPRVAEPATREADRLCGSFVLRQGLAWPRPPIPDLAFAEPVDVADVRGVIDAVARRPARRRRASSH